MRYSRTEVVYIDAKEVSADIAVRLTEFMRQEVIVPVVRSVNGQNHESETHHFSGCFTKKAAEKITKWLHENGVKRGKKKVED